MRYTFRHMLIPVFATAVFAYCLFIILSFVGQGVSESYNFIVCAVCAIAAAFVNYRFALRDRSVASIAILNAIMLAATEFFGFAAPNDLSGFWLHAIAGVCFAAPLFHGLTLCRNPIKLSTMLLYCEFSIAGTVIFIALQIGNMTAPPYATGLSVAALILNLFMLSVLRVAGPAKKPEGGWKGIQRGAMLSAALAGVVFAAVAVALFLLPASRNAVLAAVNIVREVFTAIGKGIEDFFIFLFSLFPASAQGPGGTLGGTLGAVQPGVEEAQSFDTGFIIRIVIICAIVAVVVLIIALFRMRSKKVRARVTAVMVYEEEIGEGMSFLRALLSLAGRIREWLLFRRYCSLRRDTYEGAFVRISRRAKRRGLRRGASETPRAFLYRIAEDRDGGRRFGALLDSISAAVDRRLYSARPGEFARISGAEAKTLALLLKDIGGLRPHHRNVSQKIDPVV